MIDPKIIDRFQVSPGSKVRLKGRDPPDADHNSLHLTGRGCDCTVVMA
jgi:hypothetical protein